MATLSFHCSHAKTRIPRASKFYLNDDQFSYASGRAKQFQLQTNCIKLKLWLVKVEPSETDQVEDETKQVDKLDEATSILEAEKLSALPDLALKNDEIDMLRAELEEMAKQ
ncbi:hypothetical protein FF1_003833 [Malus domestica]